MKSLHPSHCISLLSLAVTLIPSQTTLFNNVNVVVDAFASSPTSDTNKYKSISNIPRRNNKLTRLCTTALKLTSTTTTTTIIPIPQAPPITEKFLTLTQNPKVAIVIDMENVRGKTSFELDHADFLDRLMVWTSLRQCAAGRTIVVVDHGSRSSAHLLRSGHRADGQSGGEADGKDDREDDTVVDDADVCVAFAGPHVKADDVIARDVRWLLSSPVSNTTHVVVITADQELAWRCRSAARANSDDDTKLNSVLRGVVDGGVNDVPMGGGVNGNRKQRGKKGRKKSRAARKRQYAQQYLEEEEEEEEEEGGDGSDSDVNDTTPKTALSNDIESQNSTNMPSVEVIAPQRFLEDLEYALHEWLQQQQQEHHVLKELTNDDVQVNDIPIPTPVTTYQTLFQLRGQILSIESSLRKKCSLRKRHTLTGELRKCKEEWKDVLSSIAVDAASNNNNGEVVNNDGGISLASSLAWSLSSTISSWDDEDSDDDGGDGNTPMSPLPTSPASPPSMSWEKLPSQEQEKLLLRWGKRRGRHGTRREKTEDRIVLAERLRRQLELILDSNIDEEETPKVGGDGDNGGGGLVDLYAEYVNSMCRGEAEF